MTGARRTTAALVLAAFISLLCVSASGAEQTRRIPFRAVWVSTVYNLDYPSRATTDPEALKREADEILQKCVQMGMTAVILQVRPSCDALYPSKLFPWSRYLTGTAGTAPSGGFDPLDYWVTQAHRLGLELHAWLNPFRVTTSEYDRLPADSPAAQHPDWVVKYNGGSYLNPGLPEVRELVVQGAEELLRSYPLDGIHLDDYFYPGSDFDDAEAYAAYGGGFRTIGDWRRNNINLLIQSLDRRLHAIDPELSFGVSPSGVWADRSSQPEGSPTTGGYESYYAAYADSRKWVKEGWVDYICPQIYWYIGHPSMDYAAIARWWADTVKGTDVALYIGMADYQAGKSNPSDPWYGTKAIRGQLDLNRTLPQVAGEVHFRYSYLVKSQELFTLYRRTYLSEESRPSLAGKQAYVEGSGGLFRPEAPLSRGEAAALLARLSTDASGRPIYTGTEAAPFFPDVPAAAWYAPYISFVTRWGIADGYLDGTFRPEASISRAELLKLLCAYFDPESVSVSPFCDIPQGHWAAEIIAWAAEQGWVSGYPDGTFRPEQTVSRAEAVKMINRALGRADAMGTQSPFPDVPLSHWACGAIRAATSPS